MPECLLLTANAQNFAVEIERVADFPLGVTPCLTPAQALAEYRGQHVIFGEPRKIASVLEKMPEVEWVQSTWTDVMPLVSCKRRDDILTGVKGVFGPQMS